MSGLKVTSSEKPEPDGQEENESIEVTNSELFVSPRLPPDQQADDHDNNNQLSDDEEGGLDELIIMDELEQAERENQMAGTEDVEIVKE